MRYIICDLDGSFIENECYVSNDCSKCPKKIKIEEKI